jgi:large subunit ribosomal protein L21
MQAGPGDKLRVETVAGEVGQSVVFDRVLLWKDGEEVRVGNPYLDGVQVKATLLEQGRSPKILVFKKKRRKQYRRTKGHRQGFTAVRIDAIGRG